MPRKSSIDLAFPASSASRVTPPDDLTGAARAMFVDLVLGCRPDHFQNSDIALLVVYSKALVLEKTASAGLQADGFIVDDKPSAWLPILQASTRVISTYSRMLRLNPSARSMSSPAPEAEPGRVSAYERMALEAERDGRN
jgi:phage terminase small subunit